MLTLPLHYHLKPSVSIAISQDSWILILSHIQPFRHPASLFPTCTLLPKLCFKGADLFYCVSLAPVASNCLQKILSRHTRPSMTRPFLPLFSHYSSLTQPSFMEYWNIYRAQICMLIAFRSLLLFLPPCRSTTTVTSLHPYSHTRALRKIVQNLGWWFWYRLFQFHK